jgi:hypothetical protein
MAVCPHGCLHWLRADYKPKPLAVLGKPDCSFRGLAHAITHALLVQRLGTSHHPCLVRSEAWHKPSPMPLHVYHCTRTCTLVIASSSLLLHVHLYACTCAVHTAFLSNCSAPSVVFEAILCGTRFSSTFTCLTSHQLTVSCSH